MVGHVEQMTFREMRAAGVTAYYLLLLRFKCSHHAVISAGQWPEDVRLSDIEPQFVCSVGLKGAEVAASRFLLGCASANGN